MTTVDNDGTIVTQSDATQNTGIHDGSGNVNNTPGPVPYARFSEVVNERNQLRARVNELEPLQAHIDSLTRELAAERANTTRQKIAAEFNLSPVMAERLRGNDEAELRADAQMLADALPRPVAPNIDSARVSPNLVQAPNTKRFDQMTQADLEALYTNDPEAFRALLRG